MASLNVNSHVVSFGSSAVYVVSQHSPLAQLVSRPAVTIGPEATLADAVDIMRIADVSARLVEEGGGILTERDIARAGGDAVVDDEVVDDVATRHPLVMPASMRIVEACGVMLNAQVRHLVVEFDEGPPGVVSLRDIAAVFLQAADPPLWLASLRVAVEAPSEVGRG